MACFNVLYVEDDDAWAELVSKMFSGSPYRIQRASSGAQALSMASKTPPDVVILDIGLPDISGYELLQRLRRLPGIECPPAVAFTSHQQEKIKSLRLGADAFVSKAGGGGDLLPTVEALMRRVELDAGVLVRKNLRLDPRGSSVYLDDRLVATLTVKEFLFFYALVKKSPESISDGQLRRDVLHEDGGLAESRSLVMLATRTRKRLGRILAERIHGSRRFGWRYDVPSDSSPANLIL